MKPLGARETTVKDTLDRVRERCDAKARRAADPVSFVHRFDQAVDREIVGLVAACTAFGNVKAIQVKLEELMVRLGPHPAELADDTRRLHQRLRGWKHRVFKGEDIAHLIAGARSVQRTHGSLGVFFKIELARADERASSAHAAVRDALCAFCDAIRAAGGLGDLAQRTGRRGPAHLLSEPRGSSGNKRLLLFLRWMVRKADGIDLGDWSIDPSRLLIPVDVHIHRLSRNLGLTERRALSWSTTEEITRALARFDPDDPTKYDFSLCHMGMLKRCPSHADAARCEGCGVLPVCVHWKGARGKTKASRRAVLGG